MGIKVLIHLRVGVAINTTTIMTGLRESPAKVWGVKTLKILDRMGRNFWGVEGR